MHTSSPRHIRSNLTWDDEFFILRIPVSTHTGSLMLKYVDAEVRAGDVFLGMCSIPLSEVDGTTREFRLMTRNSSNGPVNASRRPALAGKGRLLVNLVWQKVEMGPDSDREHHYGTSLGRLLAVGQNYTKNLTGESWRQPPSYPQLAARRAYGPRLKRLNSRSLSPSARSKDGSFREGTSGDSPGRNQQQHMTGSSKSIYSAYPRLAVSKATRGQSLLHAVVFRSSSAPLRSREPR
jgi:hypothetical protein